ncbi:MAG: hypothetical protein JWM14_612 [Chitinophagaceae bacterium]|nr:hypothetical protein [Chitinophagaceae bacterium]
MKRYLFLAAVVILPFLSFAQHRKTMVLDVGVPYVPMDGKSLFGFRLNLEVAVRQHWLSGIQFNIANGKAANVYGYPVTNGLFSYAEIGWVNEFRLISKKAIRVHFVLNNFYTMLALNDGDHIKTSAGVKQQRSVPQRIATNSYYSLQPGVNIMFPVFEWAGPFAEIKYRFLFGGSDFGNHKYFEGVMISAGFRIDF